MMKAKMQWIAWVLSGILGLTALPLQASMLYNFQDGVSNGLVASASYDVPDTTMRGDTPTDNDGTSIVLLTTRSFSGNRHPVLNFDTAAFPTGTGLAAAQLSLVMQVGTGEISNHWSVYALPSGNATWTETSATFNNQTEAGPVPWKLTSGADAANGPAAAQSGVKLGFYYGTNGSNPGDVLTFNLDTSVMSQWLSNPGQNVGIVVYHENFDPTSTVLTGGNGTFYSSDWTTLSQRPLLQLFDIPEPTTGALLLIGSGFVAGYRRCASRK